MKQIKFLMIGVALALISFGVYGILNGEKEIAAADDLINQIKAQSSITIEDITITNDDGIRERDPFSTDLGEDYYWGLDADIDIEIEEKEPTTLNVKQSGNYYIDVDFDALKEEFPNMVAYMKINGTSVEYPIVQGEDNSYFLKHSIDDTKSNLGWPFMDYRSDANAMFGNVVIYGHNIKNKAMFGELTKLLDQKDWFSEKSNKEIYFVTDKKTYVYRIFSVYNSRPDFNYFKTNFDTSEELLNFEEVIKDNNKVDGLSMDVNSTQILTISTCYNSGRERLVIHAYLERSKMR